MATWKDVLLHLVHDAETHMDDLRYRLYYALGGPGPVKIITYRGEISDVAYFILKGCVGVGHLKEDEYVILRYMGEGEIFGEIAALTGLQRTANIITEEPCEFIILPSQTLQRLARRHEGLRAMFYSLMAQRLSATELAHNITLDQGMLRELRTNQPEMET